MKRLVTKGILLGLLSSFIHQEISGCTNLMVTKGASVDGSTMMSYHADSHSLYGELYYRPAADYPVGSLLDIYEWDTGKYLGKIRQARHTYLVVGNINEHQLSIGETTYTGREELADSTALLDYGSLIYVTLQRAKTARAAIDTIAALMNECGYYSTGESFSISDPNEVWVMDIIGKGPGSKGAVWVARRVPEGYICAHANHSRIRQFPLKDPANCVYAKDVISFARSKGWFKGADEEFSFADTYAPLDFSALRFAEARVYSIFRRAAPSQKFDIEYVKGNKNAQPLPLWIKPDRKLDMKDAIALMRDHFEGTELDLTNDIGAGPFNCPYRWRPLTWKVDTTQYFNERAISTQQTGFTFVTQARSWLPNAIGGIIWFGVDDSYTNVYVPLYSCIREVPECFRVGNGNLFEYSPTSAFWAFNFVSNWAYTRYSDMVVDILKEQRKLEDKFFAFQPAVEKAALELHNAGKDSLMVAYLTEYSLNQSAITFETWKELGQNLLVKYMDGNVKDAKRNVLHPPYPRWWYEEIIKKTGDRFKVKK